MKKLWLSLTLALLTPPAMFGQELTLTFGSEGRLTGLDLLPAVSPQEIRLEGLGLVLDRTEGRDDGSKRTWVGAVRGVENARAVFTFLDGLTAGTVMLPGSGFLVLPDGRILGSDDRFVCGAPDHDHTPALLNTPLVEPSSKEASQGPWQITLAIPFSARASRAAGGDAAMRAVAYNHGDLFQIVLNESGLSNVRLKIVGVRRLAIYDEGIETRSEFQILNDRTLGAYRQKYKADLVLMIVTHAFNPNLGGSASQFTGKPDQAYGFALLSQLQNGVLIHEGGHLLSATHDAAYTSCAPDTSRIGVTTVMNSRTAPEGCDSISILRFSNPKTPYNWYGTLYRTGDRQHCNACRIPQAAPVVSGFRK